MADQYTVHSIVGIRRFRPSVVAIVLTTLGLLACFRLGVWQLDRAEQKRALMTAFASGSERAVVVSGELGALPRYQSVELTGQYDTQRQILLDNMPSARGRPGYHVVTALQRASGGWVLVNRGWVPAGNTRTELPDIHVDGRVRIVRGQLDALPRPGLRLGAASSGPSQGSVAGWPKVLNFPEHQELTALLGQPLAPALVLLDPTQPDGYERVWQARFGFGPERHVAYAVQWFGLLGAILVTFVVVSLKKVSKDHGG